MTQLSPAAISYTMPHAVPIFRQLSLTLLCALTLLTTSFIIFILTPLQDQLTPAAQMEDIYRQVHCVRLQSNIMAMKTSKKIDLPLFMQDLTNLHSCFIRPNLTLRELFRVQLHSCCNASESIFLTKHNIVENQSFTYETSSKSFYRLGPDVYSKLPQHMPWQGRPLGRCAVVGSGGILVNSSCGEEIDRSDFIIRFNLAPVNQTDVGLGCDLMNMNPTQILRDFRDFTRNPAPLLTKLDSYGNVSFMIAAFAYTFCTKISINLLQLLWPRHHLFFFTPDYLRSLHLFWRRRGLNAPRLSTGFLLTSAALELCDQVHLYGFWPFPFDLNNRTLSYHYYDQAQSHRHMHAMSDEFLCLLQLHSQGVLTLHLQPCS